MLKYKLKRHCKHIIWILSAFLMAGCGRQGKVLNKRITLWQKDSIPYGNAVAFDNLKHIFPRAKIVINKKSPDRYKSYSLNDIKSFTDYNEEEGKSAYIIIAPSVSPNNAETIALIHYAGSGNTVFISAFHLGSILLDSLHIKTGFPSGLYNYNDSLRLSVYDPITKDSFSYAYPGYSADNFVSKMDSNFVTILGKNENGDANFIRITYKGGGAMYIHLAPLALSNFFLLHKQNMTYYDRVFSYLPDKFSRIKWDNYFRNASRDHNFTAFDFLTKHESFRWAIGLVLLLVALLFVFGAKRRQRIIPVVKPLENSSLDFVKTIGHLYYQRRDNKNLAEKMAAHFLEYVRAHYLMSTAVLDEAFIKRLSVKSGKPFDELNDLVYTVQSLKDYPSLNDEELLLFNNKLEHFYKN